MDKKLTFYVDPEWKRHGLHTPLLHPFWGNPIEEASLFAKELADSYPFNTSYYDVTDKIDNADMILAPYRHNWLLKYDPELLKACEQKSEEAHIPLFIDGATDIEHPVTSPNTYILRYGGYRFNPEPNAIHVPPLADDLLERVCGGELQLRKKSDTKPVIGFAGWARMAFIQRTKTFIKESPIRLQALIDERYRACTKGVWWREHAVAILENSPEVETNFLLRSSFSGSTKTASKSLVELREEFVQNLLSSDYGLCIRGDANASTRLFETLSLGRIPVILDTECILPFAEFVDYASFSLIVDFRDIKKLPHLIAEFHNSLSSKKFEDMQIAARAAFVQYFREDALMPHIIRELNTLRGKV